MSLEWSQGYQAGLAGGAIDAQQSTPWHFGFDQGKKDRSRRALRACVAVARAEMPSPRQFVFQYDVPVVVEVEEGVVVDVAVVDETPVTDPVVVDGDPEYLPQALIEADDQDWPSWRFGY